MNILIITTGGTIGSGVTDGFIAPDSGSCQVMITKYREAEKKLITDDQPVSFDFASPYTILSENLSGAHINKLISFINERLSDKLTKKSIDGIIVTHGTDTLQYTAAALAYAFCDSDIPIIMVSSNYILDDTRANGTSNLAGAVLLMKHLSRKEGYKGGVFVSYKNDGEPVKLHRATRLLPHMPYSDRLFSVDDKIYGFIDGGAFIPREDNDCTPSKSSVSFNDIQLISPSPVLYIRPAPAQPYPTIEAQTRMVLLDTYHSGTLGTADKTFMDFINEARDASIPVFLTGAESRMGYESTKVYNELGINILPKAAPYAMYMKLWFLASVRASDCPISEIYKNIAYEFV